MASRADNQRTDRDSAWAQAAEISFKFLFILVFVLALGWVVSNCRQVPADSRAIVLRFGTVVREVGPGLLVALPRPFEQVILLPSADRQIEFKVQAFESQSTLLNEDPRQNTAMLLTGDMSVVAFNAVIFYEITDAKAYVLSSEHIGPAIERLFVASAVAVCASRDLDTILVARPDRNAASDAPRLGREHLRSDLLAALNRRLADLATQGVSLGISVSRVDLVPSIPADAKPAFDSVLLTLQEVQTTIANGRTEGEDTAQKANQDRDRLLTDAQAMAEERVNQAKARTAAITTLSLGAQGLSGQMLSNQLYQEQIGALLGQAGQVFAADGVGGTHLILPGELKP